MTGRDVWLVHHFIRFLSRFIGVFFLFLFQVCMSVGGFLFNTSIVMGVCVCIFKNATDGIEFSAVGGLIYQFPKR